MLSKSSIHLQIQTNEATYGLFMSPLPIPSVGNRHHIYIDDDRSPLSIIVEALKSLLQSIEGKETETNTIESPIPSADSSVSISSKSNHTIYNPHHPSPSPSTPTSTSPHVSVSERDIGVHAISSDETASEIHLQLKELQPSSLASDQTPLSDIDIDMQAPMSMCAEELAGWEMGIRYAEDKCVRDVYAEMLKEEIRARGVDVDMPGGLKLGIEDLLDGY